MVKPRGEIHRTFTPSQVDEVALELSGVEIGAWCPDDAGQKPPEQVHMIFRMQGLPFPLMIRYKSPDTLGFLIEELAHYRREVWPDAEPIDLEKGWDEDE